MENAEKERKQKLSFRFVPFLPDCLEKIAKKFKKFQNTITGSFHAKIGLKRLTKRENKNYRFVSFQPNG